MRRIRRAPARTLSATLMSKPGQAGPGAAWIKCIGLIALVGSVFMPMQAAVAQTVTPPVNAPARVDLLPPSISPIADQVINEDGTTGPISFTLTDLDTPVDQLSLSGSSSNGILIPLASILFGGIGANRTVTLTPPPNLNGMAKVLIIVSDGNASTFTDFMLTVNPINDAPSISAIPDQTTQEDVTTNAIGFTIGDVDTDVNALSLNGTSSNLALVTSGKITFGGTGTHRTLRITPTANQFGSSLITVTLDDGSATSLTTFILTVSSVNDAPVLSKISNQVTQEDTPAGPITFTVSDVDTPAASLLISAASSNPALLPTSNISISNATASRSLLMTPAANQNGSAQITLTVSDGSAETNQTFTLGVVAVNDAPTISAIANQTSIGKTVGPLAFQVQDVDNAPNDLAVSAATARPALVPLSNIAIAGTGISRTVTITPVVGQGGASTITLTVSDGAATAYTSFVLRTAGRIYLPAVLLNAPCDTAPIDCYEPNNVIAQASAIPVTQTLIRGTLTDADSRDFYALTLSAGRRYTFTLEANGTDLDLYLYGSAPSFTQVAQSNFSGTRTEQIVFVPATTGTYYLLTYNPFATTAPLFKPYVLRLN